MTEKKTPGGVGGKTLSERDSIKDLERQAINTKRLVDRINRAMYGMTWEERERLHGAKQKGGEDDDTGNCPADKA